VCCLGSCRIGDEGCTNDGDEDWVYYACLNNVVMNSPETPTLEPTLEPTAGKTPTLEPTLEPTPDQTPTLEPTLEPTPDQTPTLEPTLEPTPDQTPTLEPTLEPTANQVPTLEPTLEPTIHPLYDRNRCKWSEEIVGSIAGNNIKCYSGESIDSCKAKCDYEENCKSIDFKYNGVCCLGSCRIGDGCTNDNDEDFVYYACLNTSGRRRRLHNARKL